MELRKVGIAGLHGDRVEACTEHGGVALIGNGADEHAPQAKEAGLRQLLHDLTSHLERTRQIGLARQGGDKTATSSHIGLQILERLDPLSDFGIVHRTDVTAVLAGGVALWQGRAILKSQI
ncbi:hypothetical protein [Bradyrhizobium hereditatis]|uniref:hypothetical protein n=1 Tax=Bradyrhizobium hereditatis TaxID=2821405 RepID=UPI001CE26C7C|nr:hypothetical protein [Bradyrhizobium hereditatis]